MSVARIHTLTDNELIYLWYLYQLPMYAAWAGWERTAAIYDELNLRSIRYPIN